MIDCPDCGKSRSDQADSVCPNCGHVLGAEQKKLEANLREKWAAEEKEEAEAEREKKIKSHYTGAILCGVMWLICLVYGFHLIGEADNYTQTNPYGDVGDPTIGYIMIGVSIMMGLTAFGSVTKADKLKNKLSLF